MIADNRSDWDGRDGRLITKLESKFDITRLAGLPLIMLGAR